MSRRSSMKWMPLTALLVVTVAASVFAADVPEQINYQAKIEANGVPFDGVGHFKFAIVGHGHTNTYWSNDGTRVGGGEPTNAVALSVHGGLLNTMLGDASHGNMTPIPASTFAHPDAHIRMWFGGSDGTDFEHLVPDKPLGSVPYALMAQTVPDGSLTGEKIARESVWPVHAGRDNTVVSYFGEYVGANFTNVATIASNKNYIVTDIVFGHVGDYGGNGGHAGADIRYTKDDVDTVLFRQVSVMVGTDFQLKPVTVHLRSGLVVPAGATLKIGSVDLGATDPQSCSVSGFEIPVE
jgi:hypothetical protein